MRSEIISQEGNVVVVKCEYEASEVDAAVAQTVRELSQKANIKGFRRGHVPRKTLEMFFGRAAIYGQTADDLIQKAFNEVVSEYDLEVITNPKLDTKELNEGASYVITYTAEVRPEVTLPDLSTLEAKKPIIKVTDEEVDHEIGHIMEANAKMVPTDDDREATADDIVKVEYSTFRMEKDVRKDIDKNQSTILHLSAVRPEFTKAIAGHKPAEIFTFDITLEDDYPDKRIAGATMTYEMEILSFMKREIPELNDDTIKELSKDRYETVDAFRAELRKQMEQTAADRADAALRESALEALAAAAEVDVPDTMIDRQFNSMRQSESARVQRDLGETLDEYLKRNSLVPAEFDKKLREDAAKIVRNTLVLDALTDEASISFTNEDISEEIVNLALSMRMNPQELADRISNDREQYMTLATRVRTRNTLKHLASSVKVIEVEPETDSEHDHEHSDH